jgi:hypothetical protein
MISRRILWCLAAGGLSLAAFSQNAPRIGAVPRDPLELVTGEIQDADTPASREPVLQLLGRARNSYALRAAGMGYDLKVTFTVNSGGQTEYDGAWEMEDVFDPNQGLRWTAKAAAGYSTTQIISKGKFYGEGTANTIPLRLQEARAALLGSIGSFGKVDREFFRTSTATFHGAQVTCVLRSSSAGAGDSTPGRKWEETEECVDPQSGLLQVHSAIPGRYYAYDYSNAAQLGGHILPGKVTVTEAGKIVSEISVQSLSELPSADPALFVPTKEMKANGQSVAMGEAEKVSIGSGGGPFPATTVCVFGLVTAWGRLVEAHSLQPSDPNSEGALEAAKKMNFIHRARTGGRPQQYFVFVIEKFAAQ